jgi:hypothetical protein
MNEIGSLFLATLVLAVGGVGLYVYKTPELYEQNGGDDEDIEEEKDEKDEKEEKEENYDEPKIIETKPRGIKSKKNRRKTVGTKRRYY